MLFVKLKLWIKQFLERDSLTWNALEYIYERLNNASRLKGALGTLPDFLIIGVQRGGTTSLYHYLLQHPHIHGATTKQIEYFSKNYDKSIAWYRSYFPLRITRKLCNKLGMPFRTGEASTEYLHLRTVAERARELLPDTQIIVLLRDPVNRAYSHYNHAVKNNKEDLSFAQAIEKEQERIDGEQEKVEENPGYTNLHYRSHTYLTRGKYAEFLKPWFDHFDRDQIKVIKSENLFQEPGETTNDVFRFLGVKSYELDKYHQVNKRDYEDLDEELKEKIQKYYEPHIEELKELIGQDMEWFES